MAPMWEPTEPDAMTAGELDAGLLIHDVQRGEAQGGGLGGQLSGVIVIDSGIVQEGLAGGPRYDPNDGYPPPSAQCGMA